jgi:hypothetical protein
VRLVCAEAGRTERFGIWGGLGERERRRLARRHRNEVGFLRLCELCAKPMLAGSFRERYCSDDCRRRARAKAAARRRRDAGPSLRRACGTLVGVAEGEREIVTASEIVTVEPGTCGARLRDGSGRHCRRPAGWGTDHYGEGVCKLHGGSTRNHRVRAFRAEAVAAVDRLGLQLDVEPDEALLVMVRMASANVAYFGSLVGALNVGVAQLAEEGPGALYGPNHSGDAVPHVLVNLYGEWCDRLVRYAKAAADAGVAQRRIELEEGQGRMVAQLVRAILGDPELGLDERQAKAAPMVAHRHLQALAMGSSVAA